MRPGDAWLAAALGARYVGVIFAGGPRAVSAEVARSIVDAVGDAGDSSGPGAGRGEVLRVGVFGVQPLASIVSTVRAVGLDVIQLHADPSPQVVREVRAETGCEVWAAVRIRGGDIPVSYRALLEVADAIVLDSSVRGRLGGTGSSFDWAAISPAVRGRGVRGRGAGGPGHAGIVLAGGLTPENVGAGIALLAPDVVDVSSGVESAPGVKDPARMRAFAAAVRGAET
jgi:phosphoribosylanthranilate isomerase